MVENLQILNQPKIKGQTYDQTFNQVKLLSKQSVLIALVKLLFKMAVIHSFTAIQFISHP